MSVNWNNLEEPVALPKTSWVVQLVAPEYWFSDKLAVALVRFDQTVEAEPEQDENWGEPLGASTKHRVLGPEVTAVVVFSLPFESVNTTPLAVFNPESVMVPEVTTLPEVSMLNCEVLPTAKTWVGEVVPIPTLPAPLAVTRAYLLVIVPVDDRVGASI